MQYELKIDSLRLDNMELQKRLRQLSSQSAYEQIFAAYEVRPAVRLAVVVRGVTLCDCD
jgi:hypothetical protein